MAVIEEKDLVSSGLDRLISFWKDKPNAVGLLTAFLEELQEIEDTLHDLNNNRSLNTAIGSQLDVIGLLFNEPRNGRIDSIYRSALKGRVAGSRASGTIEDIKRTTKIISGATSVLVFNHYPACTYIFANRPLGKADHDIIQESHMAGVRTRTLWFNGDNYFVPSSSNVVTQFAFLDHEGDTIQVEDGGLFDMVVEDSSISIEQAGFTSLDPTQSGYVVLDDRGKFASLSPTEPPDIATGYIIDNNLNYIIDDDGRYIRYISTSGAIPSFGGGGGGGPGSGGGPNGGDIILSDEYWQSVGDQYTWSG